MGLPTALLVPSFQVPSPTLCCRTRCPRPSRPALESHACQASVTLATGGGGPLEPAPCFFPRALPGGIPFPSPGPLPPTVTGGPGRGRGLGETERSLRGETGLGRQAGPGGRTPTSGKREMRQNLGRLQGGVSGEGSLQKVPLPKQQPQKLVLEDSRKGSLERRARLGREFQGSEQRLQEQSGTAVRGWGRGAPVKTG